MYFFCLPHLTSEILNARQLRHIKWPCNSHNSLKFWFIFQKTLLSIVCEIWGIACRQPVRSYGRKHGDLPCILHRWELRISQMSSIVWNRVVEIGGSKLELKESYCSFCHWAFLWTWYPGSMWWSLEKSFPWPSLSELVPEWEPVDGPCYIFWVPPQSSHQSCFKGQASSFLQQSP